MSFLESIPVKKAIEKLSDGLEITILDNDKLDQQYSLDFIDAQYLPPKSPTEDLARMLIEISDMCQNYLKGVQHDPEERERIEKLWSIIDLNLRDFEFEKIERVRQEIGPLLQSQREVVYRKSIEKMRKKYEHK